ncbi:hypothetical protein C5167_017994 [Papaver somniferum]|uniref:Uncharacterized protein n=1 Tax=Papaver somniferum TaxID=3469 RepID=A0A4Y7IP20_PAPSO|nr:hypothetical protein C5167_017994 [Papaver somniferum]
MGAGTNTLFQRPWLIIYCPICFIHMSKREHRSLYKTCLTRILNTARLILTMEVRHGTGTTTFAADGIVAERLLGNMVDSLMHMKEMVFEVHTSSGIWWKQPPIYYVVRLNRRNGDMSPLQVAEQDEEILDDTLDIANVAKQLQHLYSSMGHPFRGSC